MRKWNVNGLENRRQTKNKRNLSKRKMKQRNVNRSLSLQFYYIFCAVSEQRILSDQSCYFIVVFSLTCCQFSVSGKIMRGFLSDLELTTPQQDERQFLKLFDCPNFPFTVRIFLSPLYASFELLIEQISSFQPIKTLLLTSFGFLCYIHNILLHITQTGQYYMHCFLRGHGKVSELPCFYPMAEQGFEVKN